MTATIGTDVHTYESKVGQARGRAFTLKQINKDVELIKNGKYRSVEWHLFASNLTGRVGPSDRLMNALEAAGISFHVHLPRS